MMLPKNLRTIFWDVDIQFLDLSTNAEFVIVRILEKGRFEDVRWVVKKYGISEIIEAVFQSPNISPATRSFWKLYHKYYVKT